MENMQTQIYEECVERSFVRPNDREFSMIIISITYIYYTYTQLKASMLRRMSHTIHDGGYEQKSNQMEIQTS